MALYEITSEDLPLDFESTMENGMVERTIRNAKNLLMCKKGEVPFDRQRGFDPALFDLPLEEMQSRLLPELDRVMLWEINVEVVSAEATLEDGETVIRCVIEVPDDMV